MVSRVCRFQDSPMESLYSERSRATVPGPMLLQPETRARHKVTNATRNFDALIFLNNQQLSANPRGEDRCSFARFQHSHRAIHCRFASEGTRGIAEATCTRTARSSRFSNCPKRSTLEGGSTLASFLRYLLRVETAFSRSA